MNLSWFIFYGRMLHMSRQETLHTRYGEMLDMISCLAIYNGANPKKRKKKWKFEEVMDLR